MVQPETPIEFTVVTSIDPAGTITGIHMQSHRGRSHGSGREQR